MSKQRKLERLLALVQKLTDKSDITLILVEGKKDQESLRKIGIRGKIACVKSSSNVLYDVLDQVSSSEIILLVDFDEYGTSLAMTIIQYLEEKRIKVNALFLAPIESPR